MSECFGYLPLTLLFYIYLLAWRWALFQNEEDHQAEEADGRRLLQPHAFVPSWWAQGSWRADPQWCAWCLQTLFTSSLVPSTSGWCFYCWSCSACGSAGHRGAGVLSVCMPYAAPGAMWHTHAGSSRPSRPGISDQEILRRVLDCWWCDSCACVFFLHCIRHEPSTNQQTRKRIEKLFRTENQIDFI